MYGGSELIYWEISNSLYDLKWVSSKYVVTMIEFPSGKALQQILFPFPGSTYNNTMHCLNPNYICSGYFNCQTL